MKHVRRLALVSLVVGLALVLGYAAGWTLPSTPSAGNDSSGSAATVAAEKPAVDAGDDTDPADDPADPAEEVQDVGDVAPIHLVGPTPKGAPRPGAQLEKELQPGPTLLGVTAEGDEVRDLQARLAQIAWFSGRPTGYYGDVTAAAISGFQAKREIPVTGEVDQRTLDRLAAMTREPTEDELKTDEEKAAEEPEVSAGNAPGTLDSRCTTGRALCIDKATSTLRWVVDGVVRRTMDTRFGAAYTPTREGLFSVEWKSRDHVSSLYDSSMPFAMFFSGGQAVHYSSDFAALGYSGASHGCVNIRDYDGIAALFDEVAVGDKVVVYWS